MKTSEVIDKFIDKNFGYKASNLYSKDNKIINYDTVLAEWFDNTLLINVTKYSVTSSKHQNRLVVDADEKNIKYYTVSDIPMGTNDLKYLYHE